MFVIITGTTITIISALTFIIPALFAIASKRISSGSVVSDIAKTVDNNNTQERQNNVNQAATQIDFNTPKGKFITKLESIPQEVSAEDITSFFLKLLNNDEKLMSSLFSLEYNYFKAILLLAFNGMLNGKEIKRLIETDNYNRKEILLGLLRKDEGKIDLFHPLKDYINSKFYNLDFQDQRILSANPSSLNSSIKLNDDILEYFNYVLDKPLFSQSETTDPLDYFASISRKLLYTTDEYSALQTALDVSNSSNAKVLDKKSFYNILFNRYMDKYLRRSFTNRLAFGYSTLGKVATDSELSADVRTAINESIKNIDPVQYNYFKNLYWVYNNTDNYITATNFNYNTSLASNLYDNFQYVAADYPEVAELLKELFPYNSEYSISRDSKYYMSKYFMSFESDNNTNNEASLLKLNNPFIKPAIDALFDNDIVIDNEGRLITLGNSTKVSYIFDILNTFIVSYADYKKLEELITPSLSYESLVIYINKLKTDLVAYINAYQNGSKSERIFKLFFVEIIEQYLLYLINIDAVSFEVVFSDKLLKLYRLLSFVQQTFITSMDLIDYTERDDTFKVFSEISSSFYSSNFIKSFIKNNVK